MAQNIREELKKLYPGNKQWAERVDKMKEQQAIAIYLRFKSERKLAK